MGGCGSKKTRKIDMTRLDLNVVFEDHIWNKCLENDVGSFKAFFARRKNHVIEIRWEYLEKSTETEWKPRSYEIDTEPEDPIVMHYADYENKSGQEQKFTFSAERETVSTAAFEFTETFSYGADTSIEVGIPDVLKLSAGVSGEVSTEKTNSKTFESRLKWNVDSEISVNSGEKTKAEMKVVEKKTMSDFVVVNKMSYEKQPDVNKRRLPYVIKKKNGSIVSAGAILNLEAPFRGRLPEKCDMVTFEDGGRTMVIRVSGYCKSTTWQEQHVKVIKVDSDDQNANTKAGN